MAKAEGKSSAFRIQHSALGAWRYLAPIALFVFIFASFMPALNASFVDWDDDDLLFTNTRYQTLNAENLRWMFTTSFAGHFQPLTWLSYTLDWALWKRESFGYHLTNVLLHALTAIVFYFVCRRLLLLAADDGRTRSRPTTLTPGSTTLVLSAAFAAAVFAVHPLRAESVAWVAERRDVLSGWLYMLSVACYLRYATGLCAVGSASTSVESHRRWWFYCGTLIFALLSLLAKAAAVTLPVVLLILDVYPLRRLGGERGFRRGCAVQRRSARGVWVEKLPLFALGAGAGVRALLAQAEQGALWPLSEHDLWARCAQACYGLCFYAWKTFWPTNLGPVYAFPPREVLLGTLFWWSGAIVAIVVVAAVVWRRRRPAIAAASAVYAVSLAPVLGFAQSGPQFVADRYSYIPCMSFAVLVGGGLLKLLRHPYWSGNRQRLAVLGLGAAGVLTALHHAAAGQSAVWLSSLTLWAHGVQVSPNSWVAQVNYADVLAVTGNLPAAAEHYRRGLALQPRDAVAAAHLADVLVLLGDAAGAREMYERSIELDPDRAAVYRKLAQLLSDAGRPADAAALLRRRIQASPDDLAALAYLADMLATHPDETVRDGGEAVVWARRVNDAFADADGAALLTWATALAEAGCFVESISTAERALQIAEQNGDARLSKELRRRLLLFRDHKPFHYGE